MNWIVIPRWEDFQHRDMARSLIPPWIKVYTELMSKDEYLELSFHLRGILVGLWMEYATSKRQLRGSTLSLSRRLGQRVTTRDLERLRDAGFIELSASNLASEPASEPASLEIEIEKEKESPLSYSLPARPPIDPEREAAAIAALEAMGEHVSLEQKLRASIALAESRKNSP